MQSGCFITAIYMITMNRMYVDGIESRNHSFALRSFDLITFICVVNQHEYTKRKAYSGKRVE